MAGRDFGFWIVEKGKILFNVFAIGDLQFIYRNQKIGIKSILTMWERLPAAICPWISLTDRGWKAAPTNYFMQQSKE